MARQDDQLIQDGQGLAVEIAQQTLRIFRNQDFLVDIINVLPNEQVVICWELVSQQSHGEH